MGVFLSVVSCLGVFLSSCEISTTVRFDIPDYEPVLVIHGVASPQSGAVVLIKYNQPLFDLPGMIPDLPALEVNLLEEGRRIQRLHLDSVSINSDRPDRNNQTGYFRISADSLELKSGILYSLEVNDLDENIQYISSGVYLPNQPHIDMLEVKCNSDYWDNCSVTLDLDLPKEPVSAISIKVNPPDSILVQSINPIFDHRLFGNITWPDIVYWEHYNVKSSFSQRFSVNQNSTVLLKDVTLRVAYLSPGLSQLLREINETFPPGEDIFANPRPFHSNFSNTSGIFGLYNEEIREIELN